MKRLDLAELRKIEIIRADEIRIDLPSRPIRYYRHGWQSWSLTAWTGLASLPIQRPAILHPLQTDLEYVHEKNPNGSWLGAVEFEDGNILLLGALATDAHVILVDDQLSGRFESGEEEWLIAFGPENVVFEEYAKQLAIRFGKLEMGGAPRVWCSWYSLYTAISEPLMHKIIDGLGDLPFDVIQIDDGWQKDIGDWEPNSRFPSGMNALAEKISYTGRRAGLWLAPLIATRSSRLFRKHSDWFLRDERGRFVSAGFNWGEQLYALDTTHPAVTDWLVALMKQARAWGFDYLKLDFLYAGALKGKRYADIPREAAYRRSLRVMRQAMGQDAFFLACGTPILPALGICDAIRIGPDVSGDWESYRDANLLYNPTTPGVKNAIRTAVHRLWLNSIIQIDPDVAYFAARENRLSQDQKSLLQDLALICNFRATSDLPLWMTNDERERLRQFLTAQPTILRAARYMYQLDGRSADFAPAIPQPPVPQGLAAVWAALIGWLGSIPLVLRVLKIIDDWSLKRRQESL